MLDLTKSNGTQTRLSHPDIHRARELATQVLEKSRVLNRDDHAYYAEALHEACRNLAERCPNQAYVMIRHIHQEMQKSSCIDRQLELSLLWDTANLITDEPTQLTHAAMHARLWIYQLYDDENYAVRVPDIERIYSYIVTVDQNEKASIQARLQGADFTND